MTKFSFLFFLYLSFFQYQNIKGQDVYRDVEGGRLFGKIEKNIGNKKGNVLIIFIQGSGPTDLDGNSSFLKCNNFKMLSDKLLGKGYSVFRFDKRGVAKSKFKNLDESKLTIDLLVNDVVDWVNYLKKNNSFKEIYLLGHSEGSLIAGLVFKKVKIAGLISVSGTGRNSNEILKDQFLKLDSSISSKALIIIDSLSRNHIVKEIPFSLYSVFRPSVQPYLLSWFKYNPSRVYQTINTKNVLIIHGGADSQVDVREAYVLSKNKIKTVIIPKMNHLLKIVVDKSEDKDSYINPNYNISDQLILEISNFINRVSY